MEKIKILLLLFKRDNNNYFNICNIIILLILTLTMLCCYSRYYKVSSGFFFFFFFFAVRWLRAILRSLIVFSTPLRILSPHIYNITLFLSFSSIFHRNCLSFSLVLSHIHCIVTYMSSLASGCFPLYMYIAAKTRVCAG